MGKTTEPSEEKTNDRERAGEKVRKGAKPAEIVSFPVMGIGGSAGAFKSLKRFFMHAPTDAGIAFVVITNLILRDSVNVAGLIQKFTTMPVVHAEADMPVKPGHVYVIPSDKNLDIHKQRLRFAGIVPDIAQKKQLSREAKSLEQFHQNNVIAAGLQAQEKERKRISELLHDSVSQLLYGIKLNLQEFSRDSKDDKFAPINLLIDQAINETRNISFELAPSILHDFGLIESVKEMARRLSTPAFVIRVNALGPESRFNPDFEISAFRIIQELINNSIKHGGGSEVTVSINLMKEQIAIMVKDNGAGFDTDDTGYVLRGSGLLSIKNRVSLLNGTLNIKSALGKGTIVNITLQPN